MARPLKVGIQLPEVERPAGWAELLEMAQTIERVGFDSVWVADHLLYRDEQHDDLAPWEAWSVLAALAAVTSRVELGPLVACGAFHNPAVLAKKVETIDEISGGRLIFGLGAGWNRPEFDAFGLPFDHRFSRFQEAFAIIRGLLRDGRVDFAGEFHSARDCVLVPRGPRPTGIPIVIGTQGEQMLRLCARHADGWNAWYSWFGNNLDGLMPFLAKVDAACAEEERDPATLERSVAFLIRLPHLPGVTGEADRGVSPLEGSPEELAEVLRRVAELGIGHVQLVLDPISPAAIEDIAPVLELLDRG